MITQTQGQSPADNEVAKLRAEIEFLHTEIARLMAEQNRASALLLAKLNLANDPTWDREKL